MEWAVYARQSVEKLNSISIDSQIEFCKKAAGRELKEYRDSGFSGKNTQRPAFQRLLKDVEENRIQRIYVYRLDRFSRSVADFGRLWEILREHNVEFVSISENFDTSTPMGRAMLHIIMVFAQLERETTAERVKDNYYRRTSLGAWPGGPAPYGFTVGRSRDESGRAVPTLVADPAESAVVLRIFEAYAEKDASLGSVARILNAEGIPAPKRATWDNVSLSRVLHSPNYVMADEQVRLHYQALGANVTSPAEAFDGVHGAQIVGRRSSNERKYTSVKEHSVSVLNSLGFVPAGLWLRCQEKLQRNRQIGNNGKGTHTWLTGLLKCASCGYALKVVTDGGGQRRLLCSGRYNLSQCHAEIHADLDALEAEIGGKIQDLLDEVEEDAPAVLEESRDMFARELAEIDRRADRIIDAFSQGEDMNPAYLQRALARLEEERTAILRARKHQASKPVLPRRLKFPELSFEEKKKVAAQFIRRVEVGSETAEVQWNI